mgnify:CR=1 FL=1
METTVTEDIEQEEIDIAPTEELLKSFSYDSLNSSNDIDWYVVGIFLLGWASVGNGLLPRAPPWLFLYLLFERFFLIRFKDLEFLFVLYDVLI